MIEQNRPNAGLDIEIYKNYTLIKFLDFATGKFASIEMFPGGPKLDKERIRRFLRTYRLITFNGINYDIPILLCALEGMDTYELKEISDRMIKPTDGGEKLKWWDVEREFNVFKPGYLDHVDLIEIPKGDTNLKLNAGLKLYAARINSKRIQDLPIDVSATLTREQMLAISQYCGNDLLCTRDLFNVLKPQIDLRVKMSALYGLDLRSKSDAQIAEAVIIHEVEKHTKRKVYKPENYETAFNYQPPSFLKFKTPEMQKQFELIKNTRFKVVNKQIPLPKELEVPFTFDGSTFQMGIGGLHSQEKHTHWISDNLNVLMDADVTSYYPFLILLTKLFPKHIGEIFLTIYRKLVYERIGTKRKMRNAKNEELATLFKIIVETLKIILNGTFGKLGDKWSKLFSPSQLIQVTVTGQLAIMMLMERLTLAGMKVTSVNTDGVTAYVPVDKLMHYYDVCFEWEAATGLPLEFAKYRSQYNRDVNNYFAITDKGKVKRKGIFGKTSLDKNQANEICGEAVIEYVLSGTDIRKTIESCLDIRKFLNVRRVSGGAEKDGEFIGKAVRWYYSTEVKGIFTIKGKGHKVARTNGARPMMELVEGIPSDIDYDWYVREAYGLLEDCGVFIDKSHDPAFKRGKGQFYGRRPDEKSVHIVSRRTHSTMCGKALKGRHDKWIQYPDLPDDYKACSRCSKQGEL